MLDNTEAMDRYMPAMRARVGERLEAVYRGMSALRDEGLPVDVVQPQGAMYTSARFALHGMQTPDGATLHTDEDVRSYLLASAGLGAIPFNAFGTKGDRGWFRISVGVISVEAIDALIPRLRSAIEALEGSAVATRT